MVATRAAVDRCGAGYGDPPFALQGGHRERRPKGPEDSHQAPGWDLPSTTNSPRMMAGPPGGSGQRLCLSRWPQGLGQRHAGIGYELVLSSRCSCAADGGTVAECPSVLRRASACGCRAGYRRAQDLTGHYSAALGGLSASTADGGPVGGCANCRVLFFAPAASCRADR